jgi:hypothetical protein
VQSEEAAQLSPTCPPQTPVAVLQVCPEGQSALDWQPLDAVAQTPAALQVCPGGQSPL